MDDRTPSPLRWPLAVALVGALVIVVLVGGVVLARRLQASGDVVSVDSTTATRVVTAPVAAPPATAIATATPLATARPAATPTVAAAPPTAVPATATPPPAAAATAQPVDTPTAKGDSTVSIVLDNGTPRVIGAGTPLPPPPTPTQWWSQSNTVSPELATELTNAFQRFWQVRAQAMLDLNTAPLTTVMDGPLLQREQAGLDQMRAQNQAEQIDVQHHMQITHATDTEATIVDNYTSHTVPVDLASNELGTPSPVGTWHLAYHFQKLGGTWKVVEAVQLQS